MSETTDRAIQGLAATDRDTRRQAAVALRRLGDPRSAKALARALGDDDRMVRRTAARALGGILSAGVICPPAVEGLIGLLGDGDHDIRATAAEALGRLGEGSLAAAVAAALAGDARALAGLGDPRALAPLARALESGTDGRAAAARALGELGDARAVPTLIRALGDVYAVRAAAAAALERLGEGELVTIVGDALEGRPEASARLQDVRAVVPLARVAVDGRSPRRLAAVQALGLLGDAQGIPALATVLLVPEASLRTAAVEALVRVGPPAVAPLLALLGTTQGPRRAFVVGALGRLQAARAVAPLVGLLTDDWFEVRIAAAEALGRIGGPAAAALPSLWERLNHPRDIWAEPTYREAVEQIEAALRAAPAELEAASAPEGTGTEPEAASPPAGTGAELESAQNPGTIAQRGRLGPGLRRPRRGWPAWRKGRRGASEP